MQPTLITERLRLRPATAIDVDFLWTLWTLPDVRRFLWDDQLIARETAEATLADALSLAERGLGLWVLVPPEHERPPAGMIDGLVGCAGLLPVTTAAEFDVRIAGMVEPLVALAPSAWGRGFASEALAALQRYAGAIGLTELAGVTDVPNAASDRMLRRAGFEVLGEVAGPRYPLRTYRWRVRSAE